MDIRTLIYSKQYDTELTHKLLHLSGGSSLIEDLIDFIGEFYYKEKENEYNFDNLYKQINVLKEDKASLEEELVTLRTYMENKLNELKDHISLCDNIVDKMNKNLYEE